jgi:hypothetical protein
MSLTQIIGYLRAVKKQDIRTAMAGGDLITIAKCMSENEALVNEALGDTAMEANNRNVEDLSRMIVEKGKETKGKK